MWYNVFTKGEDAMKKVKLVLPVVVALALGFTGYRLYDQKMQKDTEHKYETAAAEYISDKYGFSVDTEYQYEQDDHIALYSGYEDRDFLIYKDTATGEWYDSYQYRDVKNALEEQLNSEFPDCTIKDFFMYGNVASFCLTLDKDSIFDGDNLDEIMENASAHVAIYGTDTDFLSSPLLSQLEKWNVNGTFISFDSTEHMEEYLKMLSNEPDNTMFAPYIQQDVTIDKDGIHSNSYNINEGDGFKYCYQGEQDISANECDAEELFTKIYGTPAFESVRAKRAESLLSKAYTFSGKDNGDIYVYYPLSNIEDTNDFTVAWYALVNGLPEHNEYTSEYMREYPNSACMIFDDNIIFKLPAGESQSFFICKLEPA